VAASAPAPGDAGSRAARSSKARHRRLVIAGFGARSVAKHSIARLACKLYDVSNKKEPIPASAA